MADNLDDKIALEIKAEHEAKALKSNLTGAFEVNPDKQAELNKLSAKTGVPSFAFGTEEGDAWVKSLSRMKEIDPDGMVKTHPMTAKALTDEQFAKIAHDDVENLKGIEDAYSVIGRTHSSTVDEVLANTEKQAALAGYLMLLYGSPDQDIDAMSEFIADRNRPLVDAQTRSPQYVKDFQEATKDDGFVGTLVKAPFYPRAVGRIAITQIPNSILPSATGFVGAKGGAFAGGALGSLIPGIGTAAGAVVGGIGGAAAGQMAGSVPSEVASWIDQEISDAGYDVTNKEDLKKAFRDPVFLEAARKRAEAKGITTASIDALWNATFAGRFTKGLKAANSLKAVGQNTGKVLTDVGVQAVGEGVSEAGGQLAATGEVDGKDVALEMVGSLGQSVFDTSLYSSIRKGDVDAAAKGVADQKLSEVQGLHDAAQKAKTLQRDPAAVKAMIEASNPDARVYVDGTIAQTYFQELDPESRARMLEAIPDLEERIQEASVSGGDVMLNRSDYVAYIASSDAGRGLMEHVKFEADDLTVAQLSDPEYLQTLYDLVPQDKRGKTDIETFTDRITQELQDSGRIGTQGIARESVAPLAALLQTARERGGSERVTQALVADGVISAQGPVRVPKTIVDFDDVRINEMREYSAKVTSIFKAQETRRANAKAQAKAEGRTYREPKKRGKSKNLPVLKFLASRGGVLIDSPLAAELKAMDVTPKNAPWLFRKQGTRVATAQGVRTINALSDIDTVSADEINAAIGLDVFQNTGTDFSDTDASYVDPGDLLAAIDSELRGAPVVDNKDPMEAAYEDFERYLFELGLDLDTATNEQIKAALDDPATFLGTDPTLDAEIDADGVTYNQEKDFRFTDDPRAGATYQKEIADGVYFEASKTMRENLQSIPDEQFKDLEFDMYDAAEEYANKMQSAVDEVLQRHGAKIFEKDNSRVSESVYWIVDRSDADPDSNEFDSIKVRFSDHGDHHGGNQILTFWGDTPDSIAKEILNKLGIEFNQNDPRILFQSQSPADFSDDLSDKYGADIALSQSGDNLILSAIKVPENDRGQGIGTKIMREIIAYANTRGQNIALTPTSDFGGNVARLKKWYKSLGFVENKGKNKDFGTREAFIKTPDAARFAQKNRGSITVKGSKFWTADGKLDVQYMVKLYETSNLSTFLHETGHLFLEIQYLYAREPDTAQQIKDDFQAILDFLEVDSFEAIEVKHHEKFARAFEAYLMTGNAPSVKLQPSFRSFKAWLNRIYQSMAGLNVTVTPELKAVFDRMLATDEEIAQVQGKNEGFQIDRNLIAILPKADQERYERLHNRSLEEAKENLLKKTLKQKERETTAWWKEERKKLRDQIEGEVNSDPIYRSIEFLTKGKYLPGDDWVEMPPIKIALKDAQKIVGKTIMADMPTGMFSRSGISADQFSEMIGYTVGNGQEGFRRGTGSELLFAIANAEDRKARIERLTNETMVERHGDLMTDGTIEKAALEAFNTDAQALKMEMEGKAAAKLAGLPFGSNTNFELAAQKILASKNIRDATNVDRFYLASVRSAKAYGKALRSKNYAVAVKAKQQQLLSHHLYKQAIDARRTLEKSLKGWDRLKRPDEKLSKSMDMNYVYVARAILGRYGILPYNPQNLQTFFNNIRDSDPEAYEDLALAVEENTRNVPEAVTKGNGTSQPWTQLTVEEFMGLKDTIDNVLGVGRNQKTMTIDGQKIERDLIIKELSDRLDELPPSSVADGAQKALEWHDKGKLALSGIRAGMRRVESWTQVMDGNFGGVFRKYLWNPINDARDVYKTAKSEYLGKMAELLAPHAERLNDSGEIAGYEIGYTFHSKGELIGMILHMGNESNWDKLWRGARGKGQWNPANLQAMMDRMMKDGTITKEDMDLAQGMWDLVDGLKPQAQKAHKAMYGYYFSEITAWPVQTPWGEYRGGYWPAIADNNLSQDARIRQDKEDLVTVNNSSMFPTTGRGFTKGRVENYAAPLSFELRLLPAHVDKVLRFVHLEPAVKDVAKLLNDRGFRKTMETVDPRAIEDMLIPWLQRVARQTVETNDSKWFKYIDPASRWLRASASAQAMMLNMLNAIQQVTGFAPAMYKVGARSMGAAFIQYARNPMKAHERINEASPFMRFRSTQLADNLQKTVVDIVLNRSKFSKVKDAAQTHGYIFQRILQNWVDGTTWIAAYDKASAKGMNEKEAVRYADSVVRETQGSTEAADLSKIEAGPATMRLFTMFYSYFNTQGNLMTTEVQNIVRASSGLERSGKLGYLYLMTFAVPSFMAEMIVRSIKGDLPDDEDDDGSELDDWLAWFVGSQVRYGTAMVPWVGQVLNGAINAFDDKPFNDRLSLSPVIGMAETVAKTPRSIYEAVANDGDVSRALQNTMTSVGFMTGLPLGQLGKPLGYAADVAEGDTEIDSPLDPVLGVIAGPPPANKR